MTYEQELLLTISLTGFLAVAGFTAVRRGQWWQFFVLLICLIFFGLTLHEFFGFPRPQRDVTIKGSGEEPLVVTTALYLCMVLGMLAQYLYTYFSRAKGTRRKLDWGNFLAPVLASPIVFIPLQGALQGAGIDLATQPQPRIMLFLVAFENGFFWKDFFDRQHREAVKNNALEAKGHD